MSQSPNPLDQYAGDRRQWSLALLVAANLLPLAGVFLLGWDVGALVVLYWSENLVLGFYTLLKMFTVSPLGALPLGLFFSLHYGGFCAVHGLFVSVLLLGDDTGLMPDDPWPIFFIFFQLLINVVRGVLEHAPPAWLLAFAALFVSHGVSFLLNFLFAGERERMDLRKLMAAPYGRIVILHIAILAGGFAVMALGQPVILLVILVLLKIGVDVALHLREHRAIAGD